MNTLVKKITIVMLIGVVFSLTGPVSYTHLRAHET